MDLGMLGHFLDLTEELRKSLSAPAKAYAQDASAMASTPADVKELPDSYVLFVDMPGLKAADVRLQVEDDGVLVVSGERKREEEKKEAAKYVRMERRMGKLMRKFRLPENADTESGISASCSDGVLTIVVKKIKPPEPKKRKTIHVHVA